MLEIFTGDGMLVIELTVATERIEDLEGTGRRDERMGGNGGGAGGGRAGRGTEEALLIFSINEEVDRFLRIGFRAGGGRVVLDC